MRRAGIAATLLAKLLLATLIAEPVMAQTITAPGLVGPKACLGTSEVDTFDLAEVTDITTSSARLTIKNVNNLYSQLRSMSGDGGPTSFPIRYTYTNAKTGAKSAVNVITTVDSSNPNFGGSNPNTGFAARTPFYFTVYTTANGWGESRPLTRRCFMTGGSYTITNQSFDIANTGSNGCFSISPRTPLDVRNCLCGRGARGRVTFNGQTETYDYSSFQSSLGCAS